MAVKQQKPDYTPELRVVQRKAVRTSERRLATMDGITLQERTLETHPPGLLMFTLIALYKDLYLLGVTILRKKLRAKRRIRHFVQDFRQNFHQRLRNFFRFSWRAAYGLLRRLREPFLQISTTRRQLTPLIKAKKASGEKTMALRLEREEPILRLVWRVITTLFNYAAPVFGALVFLVALQTYSVLDTGLDPEQEETGFLEDVVHSIQTFLGWEPSSGRDMGLRVTYNGVDLGYIEEESQFEDALRDVRGRIMADDAESASYTSGVPRFVLEEISRDDLTDTATLADGIIQAVGGEIEQAYGFYIEKEFYGAVTDKDAVLDTLDAIRAANVTNKPNERIDFEKSIALDAGLYPLSSVVETESIISLITSDETVDAFYEVEDGDTPTGISDKTGISYETLLEMNPQMEDDLRAGQTLRTATARPFLSVKNIYTDVYREEYEYETVETENATYARGYREVTQEGSNGIREITAEITAVNGEEIERTIIETVVIKEPVEERVIVGVNNPQSATAIMPTTPSVNTDRTPSAQAGGDFRFIWPTNGGYVSAGINGYYGHTGMDIAGPGHGAPIYAAASGRVTLARRTYVGYGQYVIIDHGNGYETLYAHNSDLYVSVGDTVGQGQVIAAMGRTGNATGNHLHFEVRYNGKILNPANFIGGR